MLIIETKNQSNAQSLSAFSIGDVLLTVHSDASLRGKLFLLLGDNLVCLSRPYLGGVYTEQQYYHWTFLRTEAKLTWNIDPKQPSLVDEAEVD